MVADDGVRWIELRGALQQRERFFRLVHGDQGFGQSQIRIRVVGVQLHGAGIMGKCDFRIGLVGADFAQAALGFLVKRVSGERGLVFVFHFLPVGSRWGTAQRFRQFEMHAGQFGIDFESFPVLGDGAGGVPLPGCFVSHELVHPRGFRS